MAIHRTWLLVFIFTAAIVEGNAQTPACNCSENLDTLIAKTEVNYAGLNRMCSLIKQLQRNG